MVAEGQSGTDLRLTPNREMDEQTARATGDNQQVANARTGILSGSTPTRAMSTGGVCSAYGNYGMSKWSDISSRSRQLVALTTLSDLIGRRGEERRCTTDACTAGMDTECDCDLRGSQRAVPVRKLTADASHALTVGLCVSKQANDAWSSISELLATQSGENVQQVLSRAKHLPQWSGISAECEPVQRFDAETSWVSWAT